MHASMLLFYQLTRCVGFLNKWSVWEWWLCWDYGCGLVLVWKSDAFVRGSWLLLIWAKFLFELDCRVIRGYNISIFCCVSRCLGDIWWSQRRKSFFTPQRGWFLIWGHLELILLLFPLSMRINLDTNRINSLCELLKTHHASATQIDPPHHVGQLLFQWLVTNFDHEPAQSCLIYALIIGLGDCFIQVTNIEARQRVKIFL